MSAIAKPDRRREEYLCTACNMELAQDVYNKLRTRDEVVFCPSCRRILYIPENLSPEDALSTSPHRQQAEGVADDDQGPSQEGRRRRHGRGPRPPDPGAGGRRATNPSHRRWRSSCGPRGGSARSSPRARPNRCTAPSAGAPSRSSSRSTWTATWPASTRASPPTTCSARSATSWRSSGCPAKCGCRRSRRPKRRSPRTRPAPRRRMPRLRPPMLPAPRSPAWTATTRANPPRGRPPNPTPGTTDSGPAPPPPIARARGRGFRRNRPGRGAVHAGDMSASPAQCARAAHPRTLLRSTVVLAFSRLRRRVQPTRRPRRSPSAPAAH